MVLLLIGLVIINLAGLGWLGWLLRRLKRRLEAALGGLEDTQSLETTIASYFKKLGVTDKKLLNIRDSYKSLSHMAGNSLQKIAVVRFNPFRHTGGDQSFVLALLDSHDSGLLLTSIHSREGTRIYVKPIVYGSSEHTLSQEETKALKQARSAESEPQHAG